MPWKPKEEPLTREQAIELAQKELAPFWFGSAPLLVAAKSGQIVTAYPLDSKMSDRPWVLVFVDPATFSGEAALSFAGELFSRYHSYQLGVLGVLKSTYAGYSVPKLIQRLHIQFPLVLDSQNMLMEAFKAVVFPKAVLIHGSSAVNQHEGADWENGFELEIQKFLRKKDPGLSLFSPMEYEKWRGQDHSGIDLGKPEELKAGRFSISGKWNACGDHIDIVDPGTALVFRSPSSRVSLVAACLAPGNRSSRVVVEVGGLGAYEAIAGDSLEPDGERRLGLSVQALRLYHMLVDLDEKHREVILRFPDAARSPVSLYGLRFGK